MEMNLHNDIRNNLNRRLQELNKRIIDILSQFDKTINL